MAHLLTDFVQVHPVRRIAGRIEHLVLERSDTVEFGRGVWQVVTGFIETGESSASAAARELQEETGIVAGIWLALPQVAIFYFEVRDAIVLSPVFCCQVDPEIDVILSTEHSAFQWLDLANLVERLPYPSQRGSARQIEELLRGLSDTRSSV